MRAILLSLLLVIAGCAQADSAKWTASSTDANNAPAFPREYRGVWVASVGNIDWPSTRDLTVAQQRAEMNAILDKCVALHLNAVMLQVRPSCDALYKSKLEPWSAYLTGQSGKAPSDPNYDPLKEWCDGAHARGLELHAWVNPFRAKHLGAEKTESSPTHVSRTHPEWVRHYGGFLWLDPGIPDARNYSLAVLRDIVSRYDVDGIHVDDYFYPYPENDKDKKPIPFPDDDAYAKYGKGMSLSDWRRANINEYMELMYQQTKAIKKNVQVGISPFGIWRPHNPPQIEGFDSYDKIYCDSKKWLNNGWLDYVTPQLYWPIDRKAQSFPVLLDWWIGQNTQARHVWPGLFTGKVGDGENARSWQGSEIVNQIGETRKRGTESDGVIHFSMKVFMHNQDLDKTLVEGIYKDAALVPASKWLSNDAPGKPGASVTTSNNATQLKLSPAGFLFFTKSPFLWAISSHEGDSWHHYTAPGSARNFNLEGNPDQVVVRAVGMLGAASEPVALHRSK